MILVHLGQPKTGTTVTQYSIAEKAREGFFCYPEEFRTGHPAHHELARKLRTSEDPASVISEASEILRRVQSENSVISSEQFYNLFSKNLNCRLIDFLSACNKISPTHALLFLRRWDEFVNSMFLQTVRHEKISADVRAYAKARLENLPDVIASIAAVRNAEIVHFHIAPYASGVDVRKSIEGLFPFLRGISDIGALPATEKMTLKQQVALYYFSEITQLEPSKELMMRTRSKFRLGDFSFEEDVSNYCVIPEDIDTQLMEKSIALANDHAISEYVEAFAGQKFEKNYVDFSPSVISKKDISAFKKMIERIAKRMEERKKQISA